MSEWTEKREKEVRERCAKAKRDVLSKTYWSMEGKYHRNYRTDLPAALDEIARLRKALEKSEGEYCTLYRHVEEALQQ